MSWLIQVSKNDRGILPSAGSFILPTAIIKLRSKRFMGEALPLSRNIIKILRNLVCFRKSFTRSQPPNRFYSVVGAKVQASPGGTITIFSWISLMQMAQMPTGSNLIGRTALPTGVTRFPASDRKNLLFKSITISFFAKELPEKLISMTSSFIAENRMCRLVPLR